jgi:hypothetical protein
MGTCGWGAESRNLLFSPWRWWVRPKRGCLLTLAYYAFPRWYEFWTATVEWYIDGENRRTRRKTCPSATLSTTNPTWIDPGTNPGLRGERLATNDLSHGTALNVLTFLFSFPTRWFTIWHVSNLCPTKSKLQGQSSPVREGAEEYEKTYYRTISSTANLVWIYPSWTPVFVVKTGVYLPELWCGPNLGLNANKSHCC